MNIRSLLAVSGLALTLGAVPAIAADKAAQQAEVQKATAASLQKFYKANPKLKEDVAKAPGYAVFTTYGMSFLVGGAGGSGLAHDNATQHVTYMNMAQASAGPQVGIAQQDLLLVFKSKKAFDDFVDKGWEASGGAAATAGAANKGAGPAGGEQFTNEANYYKYTKNGLEVGGNLAGNKFWKSKELN